MPPRKPITVGERFGRLVAVRSLTVGRAWFRCDCGEEFELAESAARSGNTSSCGCLHRERVSERNRTHGQSQTPEYLIWQAMIARCHRPSARFYADYGGRGIRVCARWRESFEAFIADVGPRPSPSDQLDRENNDRGYEPGNCRWVTRRVQMNNTRRNRVIEFRGERRTLVEWSRVTGIPQELIRARMDRCGWTAERALTQSIDKRKGRGNGSRSNQTISIEHHCNEQEEAPPA